MCAVSHHHVFSMTFCYFCRPSTNTSFCTESKECLEYELVCKTDEYEVSSKLRNTKQTTTHRVANLLMCVFRCDATAPPAGCRLMLRRISWGWVQLWPSGDCSSTSPEQMKEVKKGTTTGQICCAFVTLLFIWMAIAGVQMEMTAPVLVKVPEETKMWEPAVYTLSFPLPVAHQDKPPTPTNDKVSQQMGGFKCRVMQLLCRWAACLYWGQILCTSEALWGIWSVTVAWRSIWSTDACWLLNPELLWV